MNRAQHPHQVLIEQLGAYVDGELSPEDTARVEAHLLGCIRCRRDAALQRLLRERLAERPIARAPLALREHLAAAIDAAAAKPPDVAGTQGNRAVARSNWSGLFAAFRSRRARAVFPWLGWAVAVPLAVGLVFVDSGPRGKAEVPMVTAALADYRQVSHEELPLVYLPAELTGLIAELPFPLKLLDSPRVHLIGAWRTEIRGEPAAAIAYRSANQVVVQYIVSESLFFRQANVRAAVARGGRYIVSDGSQSVIAWPQARSGSLLIGDLPPEDLAALIL